MGSLRSLRHKEWVSDTQPGGLVWLAPICSEQSLPSSAFVGDVVLVTETSRFYVYTGPDTGWIELGISKLGGTL
jgi:hypothetical protein